MIHLLPYLFLISLLISCVMSSPIRENNDYEYESEPYDVHQDTQIINQNRRLTSIISNSKNHSMCTSTSECGNGICIPYDETINICKCDIGYLSYKDDPPCTYKQKNSHSAFIYSFFLGFGTEWFYLSRGNGLYIFVGVIKLFVVGSGIALMINKNPNGLIPLIWWLIDWIYITDNKFYDGNGQKLSVF